MGPQEAAVAFAQSLNDNPPADQAAAVGRAEYSREPWCKSCLGYSTPGQHPVSLHLTTFTFGSFAHETWDEVFFTEHGYWGTRVAPRRPW